MKALVVSFSASDNAWQCYSTCRWSAAGCPARLSHSQRLPCTPADPQYPWASINALGPVTKWIMDTVLGCHRGHVPSFAAFSGVIERENQRCCPLILNKHFKGKSRSPVSLCLAEGCCSPDISAVLKGQSLDTKFSQWHVCSRAPTSL